MVLLPLLASVAATGLPQGWEIQQAEQFCLLRLTAPDSGGSELGVALDTKDKARLILSNASWQLEPDRLYPLSAGIEGSVRARKARGLRLGSEWVALVADVEEGSFIDEFARASTLQFEVKKVKPGTIQSKFALTGTAAAAHALRACQAELIARTGDLNRLKLDQRKRAQPEKNNEDPDEYVPDR